MSATRREFLAGAALASGAAAQPAQRPNVLLLVADQFRFDCLGRHGNQRIRTPNLDRLGAAAADFTSAFVQAPVCVPSRVTLLTGRYPHSHKNRVNYTPCDTREVFLQQMLKEAGYQTGSVGKLHYYPPTPEHARATGFDQVLLDDGVGITDPYSDYVAWRKQHDPNASVPYHAVRKGAENPFSAAIDYAFTPAAWTGEQSCRMVRGMAQSPKPFFMHCSFFKPHSPHTVPAPYDSMYSRTEIPLPDPVSLEQIEQLPLPLQKLILRFTPEYNMDRTRLEWVYRSYYGGVSMVDHEIGRILDTLEESGRAQDTIVIFTTDHGAQLLEHGLQDKNVFFESSVHAPLLIRFPGRIRPAVLPDLAGTIDLVPTILELCGLPAPKAVQGKSLAGLLTGSGHYEAAEAVFSENIIPEVITGPRQDFFFVPGEGIKGVRHPDAKMIRTQKWKLTHYPGHGGELYDLAADPGETRNLYRDPASRQVAGELKERLLDWMITADENDQIAPKWLL